MQSEEQQLSPMEIVRDGLLEAMEIHERNDHGGEQCRMNRIGAIAYLAHSIGMTRHELDFFVRALEEYDRRCPGPDHCRHN